MIPILLTSNGLYHNEVFEHFNDMIRANPMNKRACIITTADQVYKEKNYHAVKTMELLSCNGFDVDFLDIEFESAERLLDYPIIYINGGNPFYLLYHIRKSKADKILIKLRNDDHFIIGQSAGAAILGQTIEHAYLLHPEWNELNIADLRGIQMISADILPHNNKYSEKKALLEKYEEDKGYKLIRIDDGKCVVL